MTTNSGVAGSCRQYAFWPSVWMCVAHLARVIGQAGAARLVVGALLVRARGSPPATPSSRSRSTCRPAASRSRRAAAAARRRRRSSAARRSRSTESIPAISITRLSWISPQRPRTCESPRSALTRLPVCSRRPSCVERDDLELLVDLAVGPLPLLLEQVDVRLDLLERLLQRLHDHAEPPHGLLGEGVRVRLQRLGREIALIAFSTRMSKAPRSAASAPSVSASARWASRASSAARSRSPSARRRATK